MELSYEKKRRNLMVTASAVLAAAFLNLDRPGVVLAALTGHGSLPPAWRVWTVVMVILIYQAWRLFTDKKTKEIRAAADRFLLEQRNTIMRKDLSKRAHWALRKIHANEDISEAAYSGQSIRNVPLERLTLNLQERDKRGGIVPAEGILRTGMPLVFYVYAPPPNGEKTIFGGLTQLGELSFNLHRPRYRQAVWKVRARVRCWIHSSDAQDFLVPAVASFMAIAWSAGEILSSLTPS